MSTFVLDNSVAMRWLLASNKSSDQHYAETVLDSLLENEAVVPGLWHLEAANVMLEAERRGVLQAGETEKFLCQLERLPIRVDNGTASQAFGRTLSLARTFRLSSYDASYLELSIRENLPLATLDKKLARAAERTEVELYLRD